jgi:hypothetical protein
MAQRRKKTVHPPLKKRQNQAKDFAEMEILLNQRVNPAKNTRGKMTKRVYQAETASASLSAGLGLPPLKMVLVHAQNDHLNATAKPIIRSKSKKTRTQEEVVMKIIEHLTKVQ